jgi:hypothetical protein
MTSATATAAAPDRRRQLLRRIRIVLALFIVGLVLSGLTAVPLVTELDFVARMLGLPHDAAPENYAGLHHWIAQVCVALHDTDARYPFLFYGFDWLAFAHIMIAIAFIGPWIDPVRNRWVLTFGLIAAVLVIPMALCVGPLRGIPFYWCLIDCSFGVGAVIPLSLCRRWATQLARLEPAGGASRP